MEDKVELRWVFSVIRRWLWLIILCTVVATVSAYWYSSRIPPVYRASATLMAHQQAPVSAVGGSALSTSEELANTYMQLLTGYPLMEAVVERLELNRSPDSLSDLVKVNQIPGTQLIRLSVEHTDPIQSMRITNATAEIFIEQNNELLAERYNEFLSSLQGQLDDVSGRIEETQSEINLLQTGIAQDTTELARLESLLAENRGTYGALKLGYDRILPPSTVSQGDVLVVENDPDPGIPVRLQPPPVFAATLLVYQSPSPASVGKDATITTDQWRTYSHMFSAWPVLDTIIGQFGLDTTLDVLAKTVKAEWVAGTQMIWLTVEHPDPNYAAMIAETAAQVFVNQIQTQQRELYSSSVAGLEEQISERLVQIEAAQTEVDALRVTTIQDNARLARLDSTLERYFKTDETLQRSYEQMSLTAAQPLNTVSIVEPARVQENPVSSPTQMYVVVAALAGVMVAVGLGFLFEYLDDTIKTPEDVSQALGLGTLGVINRLGEKQKELVMLDQPHSTAAEAFRVLRTNVRSHGKDKPLHTILVTSPGVNEGKSLIVANLAVAMAQAGFNVVAIEADLRRPRLHHIFGIEPRQDKLSLVRLKGPGEGRLNLAHMGMWSIIPSTGPQHSPAELFGARRMQELLSSLAQGTDVALLDSSPVLYVADTVELAQGVDGVLLAVKSGRTRRQAALSALESLRQVGANPLGVVLTSVRARKGGYYKYYSSTEKDNGNPKRGRDQKAKSKDTVSQPK